LKNFNGLGFYALLGFAILGGALFLTNAFDPNGLYLVYAQSTQNITGKNYDETRTYYDANSYHSVWTSTPEKLLDYTDENGNKVYVNSKIYETPTSINYESFQGSYSFMKNDCTLLGYDGGKIQGNHIKTLSHVMKSALNGTDVWSDEDSNNAECQYSFNGNQVIATKSNFDIFTNTGSSYEVQYDFSDFGLMEWTYRTTNNDITKTDQKYGFTFVCDGIGCNDVRVDNIPLDNGVVKTIDEVKGKGLKVGQSDFDLKEETHNYTWALSKPSNDKFVADFTHSKGRLAVGENLVIDPTFSYTSGTLERIIRLQSNSCEDAGSNEPNGYFGRDSINCYRVSAEWDISSIPNGSVASDVSIRYDTNDSASWASDCDWRAMIYQPSVESNELIGDDIADGTIFLDDQACTHPETNTVIDLGTDADANLTSFVSLGWWAVGIHDDQELASSGNHYIAFSDIELQVTYTTGVYNPGPPVNPSGGGFPYFNNFTWNMNNATLVTGSAIWNSTDNITYDWLTNVANGTENYLHMNLGIDETHYYKVSHYSFNNGTNSTAISLTTDNYPDAPTISANADSETQITITYDTAGASDGGDVVKDYNLQASINSGPWIDIVSNSTHTTSYAHNGLTTGDTVNYGWRDGNGVGWSSSANATAQTYEDITASLTIDTGNVGDVINATGILTVSNSSPIPVTITSMELIRNGSSVQTVNPGNSLNIESEVLDTPIWYPITNDNLYVYTLNATITNGIETIEIASSNNETITREYDPSYFVAEYTGATEMLNYTITRNDNDMTLKMNRDIGGTWKAECLHRDLSQALANEGGTWNNQTVVGYYQDDRSTANTETIYIACYNDDLLFTTTSYSNSTNSLVLGLSIFDDLGGLFGAPAVMLIILAIATMATGRSAPTILVILLTVIGIVGALGMLVLEAEVWGLLVVAGAIGIFQIRRMF